MSLELTFAQKFEMERMNRVIDSCNTLEEIRGLCKQLLSAWQTQRAATDWMMRQSIATPPRVMTPPSPTRGEGFDFPL